MKLLRSLIFVIWLYGTMAILAILALPVLVLPRRVTASVIRVYARLILFGLYWICGIRVELKGHEHIRDGAQIVAGKHQAMLDVFIPFLFFRDPVVIMKRELLWYPFLGWYALKSLQIPIDRDGGAQTMRRMLKAAKSRVLSGAGRQLVIFPEGTRTEPGALPAYKPAGIRAFYKNLDLPIIPVATNSGLCWPAHGLIRNPGVVIYEVLPEIDAGLSQKDMLATLQARLEAGSNALLPPGAHGRDR